MEPADAPRLTAHSSQDSSLHLSPHLLLQQAIERGDFRDELHAASRRSFLALVGGVATTFALAACGSTSVTRLPAPEWNDLAAPTTTIAKAPSAATAKPTAVTANHPAVKPLGEAILPNQAALPWAKSRALWAKAPPDYADLNPMLPITAITVHHDGLDDVIYATDTRTMAARIEHYRVGHRGKGWADIGYHLVIDRAGTLWQGRSIRYQGAHVKNHNEGNIGVLVMGNFERQQPTAEQMKTLERVLRELKRTYKVQTKGVYTHREWPDAETACPGKNLQPKVTALRTRLA